uniref:Uncharacterized protein n=1 Tax=Panagrolaimus davidi TaxID=227884 RepID=A0A914PXB3_9BILA
MQPSMPTNVNLTKFKVSNPLSSLPNSNTLPSNSNSMPVSNAKTAVAKSESDSSLFDTPTSENSSIILPNFFSSQISIQGSQGIFAKNSPMKN